MFQVDREKNRLSRLPVRKFSDLQIREREHLQEWLGTHVEKLDNTFSEPLSNINARLKQGSFS